MLFRYRSFKICINANDKPANPQCKINNPGAINKNVNSIGSVIPVRNDVNAAENSNPPTIFFFLVLHNDTLHKLLQEVPPS